MRRVLRGKGRADLASSHGARPKAAEAESVEMPILRLQLHAQRPTQVPREEPRIRGIIEAPQMRRMPIFIHAEKGSVKTSNRAYGRKALRMSVLSEEIQPDEQRSTTRILGPPIRQRRFPVSRLRRFFPNDGRIENSRGRLGTRGRKVFLRVSTLSQKFQQESQLEETRNARVRRSQCSQGNGRQRFVVQPR